MSVTVAQLAADIHKKMALDDRFGYSWAERFGCYDQLYRIDGRDIVIRTGDYDCSSSVITAYNLALKEAGYGTDIVKATYTGNMLQGFLSTGLFRQMAHSNLQKGDILLNEANHTAIYQGGNMISEASINEHGTAFGGVRGDQTGYEFKLNAYYDYPWDYVIRCTSTRLIGATEMALTEKDVREIWKYRNESLEKKDAYQILRDTRDMCAQLLKEVAALETEIVKLQGK